MYIPQKIYIEESVLDFPLTRRILKNLNQVPNEIIGDPQKLVQKIQKSKDTIGEGKKYLLIAKQKGSFVKPCPCTPLYIGCNYFIINQVLNCPVDCSYCILQDYLSNPLITVFANLDDLWSELDVFLKKRKGKYIRMGTGELGDSLVLDHITENSKDFVSFFRGKENAYLELKTKSTEIKNILTIGPAENVVISWSLNSFKMAEEEEEKAPRIEERIEAASQVSERGFRLGFHFDPLIRYPGWEEDYAAVIKILLNTINPARISWMSLGSLRFPPSLKTIIKERFPHTRIVYDEFIKGRDGKLRYFKPLRFELYQKILDLIRAWGDEKIPVYFCMESEEIWRKVMKWKPRGKKDVENLLAPLGNLPTF